MGALLSMPGARGAAGPGADVGFRANTGRKSAHLGTSACSQEGTSGLTQPFRLMTAQMLSEA